MAESLQPRALSLPGSDSRRSPSAGAIAPLGLAPEPFKERGVTPVERFLAKVDLPEDETRCWLWTGATNGAGYGMFSLDGKSIYAHRFSHERWVGPIPNGLQIDHLCRTTLCVNPAHLEVVTSYENSHRGIGNAGRQECRRGHPFDEVNTYRYQGRRYCRACRKITRRAHYLRNRTRTIVFTRPDGSQALVTLEEGIWHMAERPDRGGVWGPPVEGEES